VKRQSRLIEQNADLGIAQQPGPDGGLDARSGWAGMMNPSGRKALDPQLGLLVGGQQ
jgi:hypothetical protein